jgi:hydroxysqualene synthase
MSHWLDKVVTLLQSDTSDLRELARIAGGDPRTFYRGANMNGSDLCGQDLRGMEFTNLDLSQIKLDDRTTLDPIYIVATSGRSSNGTIKTDRDENFPVGWLLISAQHRATILAFYRFVRAADDIADSPVLSTHEKIARLDHLEAGLLGRNDGGTEAVTLRNALAARNLSPRHVQDLLTAFRTDATKRRYRDWDDLIGYCTYSAMPVGRFILDVHGEDHRTWPASDALCAALQVINHLQDCGKDYRALDRVYIPLDAMTRHGAKIEDLGAERASPALLNCLRDLTARISDLLGEAAPFAMLIEDSRLSFEIAVVHRLAESLLGRLLRRDPLRERVHHNTAEAAGVSAIAIFAALSRRIARSWTTPQRKNQNL